MAERGQVLLLDDDREFRKSTAWLLQSAGWQVEDFGAAYDLLEALEQYRGTNRRVCVITDVRMPEVTGLELIEEIKRRGFFLPIIVITGHADIQLAVEAMRKGAIHFLEKPLRLEALTQALELGIAAYASIGAGGLAARNKLESLTRREREVLELVVESKPNKVIAAELGISIKTVELHRANMMHKLDVDSLPELMKLVFSADSLHV